VRRVKRIGVLAILAGAFVLAGCGRNEVMVPAAAREEKVVGPIGLIDRDELKYEAGSETPFTGTVIRYYENGNKRVEVGYRNGKQNGLLMSWYESGQKKSEHGYRDGIPTGTWTLWHENGQKAEEIEYRDGVEISRTEGDENGNPIQPPQSQPSISPTR
jgi:antitoxin component YwqK of YwqJK toxin-antitoxin module